MILIGIDPSLTATGMVIISRTAGKLSLLQSDCFSYSAKYKDRRLAFLRADVLKALAITDQFPCAEIVVGVEENYFGRGKSIRMALLHREAVGVCIEVALSFGLNVVRLQPKEGKRALTGIGSADKEQMMSMSCKMFPDLNVKTAYRGEAMADALGLALAAGKLRRNPWMVEK